MPAARRAMRLVDGRADSPGESLLRLGLDRAGIRGLELQVSVYDDDGGFVGRCDAALLKYGILLEFDGKIKYGRLLRPGDDVRSVVMREKQREQALVELGWLVIRIDWDDLSHPEHLVRRIRRAIEARSGTGFTIRGRHECMPPVRVESD